MYLSILCVAQHPKPNDIYDNPKNIHEVHWVTLNLNPAL